MKTVQSIDRAFSLLEEITRKPAGISDLARSVDLPTSTVARLLYTLEDLGAIVRTADDTTYQIGPALLTMATTVDPTQSLLAVAQPHLLDLVEALGETVGLSIPAGYDVHYIGEADSPHPVQIRDWTGVSLPMHVVPAGLVILSQWPNDAVDRFLDRPLDRFTSKTVIDPEQILPRLEVARRQGYLWAHEEFSEGINSVAAPLYNNTGVVMGALHSHGPAYRFPDETMEEIIGQRLVQVAAIISEALGYHP